MPRNVLDRVLVAIMDDLFYNYKVGDRYKSMRQLAEELDVSLQTISKAIGKLASEGFISTHEKSGMLLIRKPAETITKGRRIVVLSTIADHRFNDAFLGGIGAAAAESKIEVIFHEEDQAPEDTLSFGNHLVELGRRYGASGIVLLAFDNHDLAIYHAVAQGCIIISDIASRRLGFLPSVQTDNKRHSEYAAEFLFKAGKDKVLVADFMESGNMRHVAFRDRMLQLNPRAEIKYCSMKKANSQVDLYLLFQRFDSRTGIFSGDYLTSSLIAFHFLQYKAKLDNAFIVYDSDTERFEYPGLGLVPSAAPSFETIGRRLAEKLIGRIRHGVWSLPLQEYI